MLSLMRTFRADENGAVTVDWVVLTAAIVGSGIGTVVVIRTGALDWASDLGDALSAVEVAILEGTNGG